MVSSARAARNHLQELMMADMALDAKLERALSVGVEYLGVENGHITRIEPDRDFWTTTASTEPPDGEFPADLQLDLGVTFCRHVVDQGESLPLHDVVAQGWGDDVAHETFGISCYHGTPLLLDGEIYGTVCFVAEPARGESFTEAETTFAELVARTIEHEIQWDRSSRKLQRLDEFASVLSHDLRNPLNVAQLRVGMLPNDENVDVINRSLQRMEDLISNVLTMAREGQDVEETEPVTLSTVTKMAWSSVDHDAAELIVDSDLEFMADRDRLRRVLENLFRNAIDHGREHPTVRVGALSEGPGFYVEDDGPGIPAADRDDIFEAGFSTGDEGVGLGLAIVESIADAHGWTITVGDGQDGGARFEISGLVPPQPQESGARP